VLDHLTKFSYNENDLLKWICAMSSRGRITIADVAREAGVSPGTVSRVLNRRDQDVKISEATQRHVVEAAERLGYQANPFASALRTQQSGVIGAIIRDINDPFLSLMARELQNVAHAQNIELLMGHAENDLKTVLRQIKFMRNWFDGLLIIGDIPGDHAVFQELERYGTPFVTVACEPRPHTASINIDESCAIQLSMDYLYGLGHRRVGFIGNLDHAGTRARYAAFRHYTSENTLYWDERYLQHTPYSRSGAIFSTQRLLSLAQPPSAIVCTSDLQALGAITGAWQMGWRVPEGVSIIGFDDIEEGRDTFPPLTTIRQPVRDMANTAMHLLLEIVRHPDDDLLRQQMIIQPDLIVRRSCTRAIG
jgi:LacI family transcriptional regulator, repressor for deo operon, udp, cdd, tsx, nupC, and nupG